jgi:hypothetical protein
VPEHHLEPPAVLAAGNRPLVLERGHRGGIGQLVEGRLGKWPGQGDEFEDVTLTLGDRAQPHRDELDQPGRGLQRPAQAPDPAFVHQQSGFERAVDQLAQEERVAQRALHDEAPGRGVDRATEDGQQHLLDRLLAERPELDPPGRVVLPQHDHGVGRRPEGPPGGPHAGQDRGRTGLGQLVHQHGGPVVEQVGVVDEDQDGAPAGLVEQFARVLAQQFGVGLGPSRPGREAAGEQ